MKFSCAGRLCAMSMLLLAGCVQFQAAPAALGCDPQLVGSWAPASEGSAISSDTRARIDSTCMLSVNLLDGVSIPALGFELEGKRYLALPPNAVAQLLAGPQPETEAPATATILLRYHIDGDALSLYQPDASYAADSNPGDSVIATEPANNQPALITVLGDAQTLREVLLHHPALFDNQERGSHFSMRREPPVAGAP